MWRLMDYYKAMNSVITVSICHCITLWIKSRLISPRKQKKKIRKISQIAGMHTRYSSGVIMELVQIFNGGFTMLMGVLRICDSLVVHFFLLFIFLLKVSSSWISFLKLATFSGKKCPQNIHSVYRFTKIKYFIDSLSTITILKFNQLWNYLHISHRYIQYS